MDTIFLEASRYVMIIFIALYTIDTFYYFRVKTTRAQNRIANAQLFFLFVLHFTGNMVIYLNTNDDKMLVFYLVQVIFFIFYPLIYRLVYKKASRMLLNNTCMLLCIGFLMQTRLDTSKAITQFMIVVAAGFFSLLVPLIVEKWKSLEKGAWFYGIGGLLAIAVIFVAGNTENGAKLSFSIGGFSLQPSEFVKITFVFFVASMFNKSTSFKRVCATTAVAAAHVLVLVASKDLGSALVFFLSYLFMLYVATGKLLYMGGGLGLGSAAAVLAYKLFSHVQVRVSVWQNPWEDIEGKGWQMTQSLFAIGTGGWLGLGFYKGTPGVIPVAIKDFIFSAISEEMGAIFAICLFLICMECMIQFFWISTTMKSTFNKIIVFGLASIYGVQVFLNVAGVTNFIPSTGITLPFVSYGGSSALATFIVFGIIQGLHIQQQNTDLELEKQKDHERKNGELQRRRKRQERLKKERRQLSK